MILSSLPIKFNSSVVIRWCFFALVLFLLINLPLSLSIPSSPFNHSLAMAVKRSLSPPPLSSLTMNKKLRRLPHVFSKVLELPFDSDADVAIEDRPDCLRFVADGVDVAGEVRAHVVELHPGVTKVVIRRRENRSQPLNGDLELNLWRVRLPAAARPELAKASYGGGRLVVTVPKHGWRKINSCGEDFKGGSSRRDNHTANVLVV